MRKTILTLTAIIICVCAGAQTAATGIKTSDLKITKKSDDVNITFTATADNKAVRSDYTLTAMPVLTNGSNRTVLEPVAVQGRRAKIQAQREARSSGAQSNTSGVHNNAKITLGNGESAQYTATIPYKSWMEGATLTLENATAGCCTETAGTPVMLAQNLVIAPPAPIVVVEQPKPEPPKPVKTTGDLLAEKYPFVVPFSTTTDNEPDGSITVYFRQNRNNIDLAYMDNQSQINELMHVIKTLESSADSRVARIVVTGYASPEGTTAINDRLSAARAKTLADHILANSSISAEKIEVLGGSVNWKGLRKLVAASNMDYKDQVLNIIDNVPAEIDYARNTSRKKQLMDLGSGKPYSYMFANFFPELRNATYIRVYYENKTK